MIKACVICGADIDPIGKPANTKTCSSHCRLMKVSAYAQAWRARNQERMNAYKSKRIKHQLRQCLVCKRPFEIKGNQRKTCSQTCRDAQVRIKKMECTKRYKIKMRHLTNERRRARRKEPDSKAKDLEYRRKYRSRPEVKRATRDRLNKKYRECDEYRANVIRSANDRQKRQRSEACNIQRQLDLLSIKGFLESCLPQSSEPQPQK